MKQLSLWAHYHKMAARIIIVFIYLFLNVAGLFLGDLIYSLHIELAPAFSFLAISITVAGVVLYPSRGRKHSYKNLYVRQKFADGLLIVATFLFIVYAGNSMNTSRSSFYNPAYGLAMQHGSADNFENNISGVNAGEKAVSKKAFRKQFSHTLKELRKKYKESSKTGKTIAIILVLLAVVGLMFFMMAIVCSIACSGAEALAAIVGIVGIGAIVFGAIKLIQRIQRGKHKRKEPSPLPSA